MNRVNDRTKLLQAGATQIDADTVSSLRSWASIVSRLPDLIVSEGRRPSVRDLVTWYERVFGEEDYRVDPPIDGLDALTDELAVPSVPYDVHVELARARWAIRVAEQLVRWRICVSHAGQRPSATAVANDRLERAAQEARRQIEGQP